MLSTFLLKGDFLEVATVVGGLGTLGLLIFRFTGEGSGSNVDPQTLSFVSTPTGKGFSWDRYTVTSLLAAVVYTIVSFLLLTFLT